ncbi:MAG: hypothetical protein EBY22_13035, partial [Gammaproteobacteria bacterium]|nr:hypothetical protein [Gammaproteobacteria bacterium]
MKKIITRILAGFVSLNYAPVLLADSGWFPQVPASDNMVGNGKTAMTVTGNYPTGGISKLNLSDSAGNITTLTIAPGQPVTPDELRGVLGTKSTYISTISPEVATVPGSIDATPRELTSVTKVNWPATVIAPTDYTFTGKVFPAQVGATVKLQQQTGGKWETVSVATTNLNGSWAILWSGPSPGDHQLRITATNAK